jgi:hypothetical protein
LKQSWSGFEFNVARDNLVFIDATLAGMVGPRDLHHLQMTVAELVGGEKGAIGPAEGDPGNGRMRLQLRQEDEFALVGLAGVEHILQEQRADGGMRGAGFVDNRRDFLADGRHDLLVDGAGELPADRFGRAPPEQARGCGREQDRR